MKCLYLLAESKQNNVPSNLAARVNTSRQEEQQPIKQANDIQQQQQIPSNQQKNPAITTLASGDNKNAPGASQANETSFRKTAWIQPSSIVNNGLGSFYQPMPAWVDLGKVGTHIDTCQTNSKEVNEDQNCSQQQTNRTLATDKQPMKQTIFQPKHNFYERQLSTTFHPVTNGLSQPRTLWLNEREQQTKIFSNSQQTEKYPEQTRHQANLDTVTDSGPISYVQNKNNLAISEKKEPKVTEIQENKLKSENNNNNDTIVPGDNNDDQPITAKQRQQNSQPLTKFKKNVWQESDQKTLPKKLPASNRKPIRSILKVTSADNGSYRELNINGTQRRDIRDSLEIARQQLNKDSRETTAANTRSKVGKSVISFSFAQVHFC